MPVIESAPAALLVKIGRGAGMAVGTSWLLEVRVAGEKAGAGIGAPEPVRVTLCGLPVALSVILRVPVRVPVAVGFKVTLIVHVPPAATVAPQVLTLMV